MRILPLLLVSACGVTSHNFYLFDVPPDGVTEVKLYIAAVEAHVADAERSHDKDDDSIDNDGKWRRLEIDRIIDVARADSEEEAVQLGELGIPGEGKITQIRLVLDLSKPQVAELDDNDCDLDVSRINEQGVKINHAFKAIDAQLGEHQDIYLHIDLNRSMDPSNDPDFCFVLEPHLELHKVLVDGAESDIDA